MVDPVEAAKGAGLPFEKGSTLERLVLLRQAAREAAAAREAEGVDLVRKPSGGPEQRGTVALLDDLELGPAMPFAGPSPPAPPREAPAIRPEEVDLAMFPLERYAELSAALAEDDDRARVLRRFVLDEPMWRAIAQAWGARIAQDPALNESSTPPFPNPRRQPLAPEANCGQMKEKIANATACTAALDTLAEKCFGKYRSELVATLMFALDIGEFRPAKPEIRNRHIANNPAERHAAHRTRQED